MIEKIKTLGLSEKEARVYLYLIEYGISPASEIARSLQFPKSSVNFLAETLWKGGFLSKSIRSGTHYYEADITLLETKLERERASMLTFLSDTIPSLRSMNRNVISKPKIIFLDGEDQCKKAYLELLSAGEVFYEFGAHADLVAAFGQKFMDEFIRERIEKKIFCDSLGTAGIIEETLQKKDSIEWRSLKICPNTFGKIGSSIAIYGNRVLVLNLENTYTGVRIENREFSETMKTIFRIAKASL